MAAALSAEDRLGVMQLIASYARYLDDGDREHWVDNFMPDAVLDSQSAVANGREEIGGWYDRLVGAGRVAQDPPQLVHFVGLPFIEGDAERARAETYCAIYDYDPEKRLRVTMMGIYHDTCVPSDGRWRFERRVIRSQLKLVAG